MSVYVFFSLKKQQPHHFQGIQNNSVFWEPFIYESSGVKSKPKYFYIQPWTPPNSNLKIRTETPTYIFCTYDISTG